MAGKVTLYVRDEDLWRRARATSQKGGLSNLVQQCLRHWLDAHVAVSAPSLLERARRLQQGADALVRALEADVPRTRPAATSPARRRRVR